MRPEATPPALGNPRRIEPTTYIVTKTHRTIPAGTGIQYAYHIIRRGRRIAVSTLDIRIGGGRTIVSMYTQSRKMSILSLRLETPRSPSHNRNQTSIRGFRQSIDGSSCLQWCAGVTYPVHKNRTGASILYKPYIHTTIHLVHIRALLYTGNAVPLLLLLEYEHDGHPVLLLYGVHITGLIVRTTGTPTYLEAAALRYSMFTQAG